MKLKLQNVGEKITHIGRVSGDMVFCAWVKCVGRTITGSTKALIFLPELPPTSIVFRRRVFAIEDFPTPLVDHETEGKEGNWIPTKKGQRFFMLFRFYGATPAAYDGSFELNDIELVK